MKPDNLRRRKGPIPAMKNRQMKYGYNPARDFVSRLDQHYDALNEENRRRKQ